MIDRLIYLAFSDNTKRQEILLKLADFALTVELFAGSETVWRSLFGYFQAFFVGDVDRRVADAQRALEVARGTNRSQADNLDGILNWFMILEAENAFVGGCMGCVLALYYPGTAGRAEQLADQLLAGQLT